MRIKPGPVHWPWPPGSPKFLSPHSAAVRRARAKAEAKTEAKTEAKAKAERFAAIMARVRSNQFAVRPFTGKLKRYRPPPKTSRTNFEETDPFPFMVRKLADWILWYTYEQVTDVEFESEVSHKRLTVREWLLVCVCIFHLVDESDTDTMPIIGIYFDVSMNNDVDKWDFIRSKCDPRMSPSLVRKHTWPPHPDDELYTYQQICDNRLLKAMWDNLY